MHGPMTTYLRMNTWAISAPSAQSWSRAYWNRWKAYNERNPHAYCCDCPDRRPYVDRTHEDGDLLHRRALSRWHAVRSDRLHNVLPRLKRFLRYRQVDALRRLARRRARDRFQRCRPRAGDADH